MEKKNFLKKYNDLQEGQKTNSIRTILFVSASTLIIIGFMIWSFGVINNAIGLVKVVDRAGNDLPTETVRYNALIQTLIKNHCARTVYYANTFERGVVKDNQAYARFLINKEDCERIFDGYDKHKNYQDALQLGHIYEAKFLKIKAIDFKELPYKVKFISELTKNDGKKVEKSYIESTGLIDTRLAVYPENPNGFFFIKYKQVYKNGGKEI